MIKIVPTILADNKSEFAKQIMNVAFARHVHIDLMDGSLTDTKSLTLSEIEWQSDKTVDLHVMYDRPQDYLDEFIRLKPNMVIVQAECHCDIVKLATDLREAGIKTGLSILPDTTPASVSYILPHIQQVLIFSGHLGYFGGQADLELLGKIDELKRLHHWLEFGWDGGANDQNVKQIADAGVSVINIGSFIQKSENPEKVYRELAKLVD